MTESHVTHEKSLLGYGTGSVDAEELKVQLRTTWSEILKDPDALKEAAAVLNVMPADLAQASSEPPVELITEESGTGAVETAIIVFVTTVGYDLLKDLTKDASRAIILTLWNRVIKPRIEDNFPLGAFGEEKKIDDQDGGGSPKS